ncbi:MAG: helix-turn-helix transcriptional regulator [Duodenibacillus massiliensis]
MKNLCQCSVTDKNSARLKRRLPQTELAERCGIGLSTLVKIENGNCGVAIGSSGLLSSSP